MGTFPPLKCQIKNEESNNYGDFPRKNYGDGDASDGLVVILIL